MYAIRSKRTNRWFSGINTQYGSGSSHRVQMDEQIPALFKSKEIARIELLMNGLHNSTYEIVEVGILVKQNAL